MDPDGSTLSGRNEADMNCAQFDEAGGMEEVDATAREKRFVDRWYKSFDRPSFEMSRRLIREEGFLCGGISGAGFHCAVQALHDFGLADGPTKRCVVLLPDGILNYMYSIPSFVRKSDILYSTVHVCTVQYIEYRICTRTVLYCTNVQ